MASVDLLDVEEGKFSAFNTLAFTSVCIGMKHSGELKWLEIPHSASSLLAVFQPGMYIATNVGRVAWKGLLTVSSLQLNCNREGFNVYRNGGGMFARIGIVGNDVNDCNSPNSYLGLGTKSTMNNNCNNPLPGVAAGNLALCSSDNGSKSVATFAYVLVK